VPYFSNKQDWFRPVSRLLQRLVLKTGLLGIVENFMATMVIMASIAMMVIMVIMVILGIMVVMGNMVIWLLWSQLLLWCLG
jgi:hypothetical protein